VGFNKFKNEIITSTCDKDSFYDPFLKQCRPILLGKTKDFIDFANCKSINTYNSNEFSFLDDSSIFLIRENLVLNSSYYKYSANNDTLTTCTYLFGNTSATSNEDSFLLVHDFLTKLGITLSLAGLIVLLIIYFSFSKLRNLPGLNLICLCISYITVYLVIISSIILMKYTKGKVNETSKLETIYDWSFYILAVLLNYACLSTYSWMCIISYDICRTFMANGYQTSFKDTTVKHRLFIYHLIVGFGLIPVTPIAIALVIDNLFAQSPISPHYGGIGKNFRIAWFSNRLGLLVFYIFPVAVMLIINIAFFSVTICAIWRTDASIEEVNLKRNDSDSKRKTFLSKSHQSKRTNDALIKKTLKTKSKVLLFTKLLILMGLCWMLSFMASFLDQKWIYLVDTIVNAFQGFFISLIFIFNKKVLKLLKK
jgi:G protein-coupled receptor Mth (Methuselah protein)